MADLIYQAIQLIEASSFQQAQSLLLAKLKADPKNDVAWYWMSKVVATDDLREECLQEALKHNPQNALARAALDDMQAQAAVPASASPQRRRSAIPAAIVIFLLALALIAVTYVFTREDLAYRAEGRVSSATVIRLNKEQGSAGAPDRCEAEYQFMAYGALRKGTALISCADWDRLDNSRRMQIQYLVSQPDRSRLYPPAETTERYAVLGFGLAALLIIVSLVLIVRRFLPRKSAP